MSSRVTENMPFIETGQKYHCFESVMDTLNMIPLIIRPLNLSIHIHFIDTHILLTWNNRLKKETEHKVNIMNFPVSFHYENKHSLLRWDYIKSKVAGQGEVHCSNLRCLPPIAATKQRGLTVEKYTIQLCTQNYVSSPTFFSSLLPKILLPRKRTTSWKYGREVSSATEELV